MIDHCFGDNERKLLKHWTSIDDIVFTSTLASRRVDARLKSLASRVDSEVKADSIEEWLAANVKQPDSEE